LPALKGQAGSKPASGGLGVPLALDIFQDFDKFPTFTMEPGFVIEFFEEKRLLCAVVQELKGERLHVLTQNQREMTLTPKRVLHACPSRLSPQHSRQQWLDFLEETARRREELKTAVDLKELWELLVQEDQGLSLADMADLWFSRATTDQEAAMGRALYEDRFFFKFKEGLWVPNPYEVVEALKEKQQRQAEALRELETAAACLMEAWDTGNISDPDRRQPLIEVLRQMAVWGQEAPEYQKGKSYLEKTRLPLEEAPFRLLVRLGVFHEDENLDLYRLETPLCFSEEARRLAIHISAHQHADPYERQRVDLTHLETLTIDGERTRDFDDALSLEKVPEGWRLGIHIADVSALVASDTYLDRESMERGASIYLPEDRLPMFPEEISENTLSLLAKETRLALSFLVTLSPEAEIKDWGIHPSYIRVRRRLTYHEVDECLPQEQTLANLSRLAQKIKAGRLAKGGYELRLPEVWVTFPQGQIQVTLEDQETHSHQLVAEAMVLANWLAARFLQERHLPAIYRTQAAPREPIKPEPHKDLLELWQDRRRLSRVVMDLTPQPHWGLGLPVYTFATSPIRRYLDLVIHRQILSALTETKPAYNPEDLEKILLVIEPAMKRAGFLKSRRLRYWLLKYLAGKVGQKVEALVLEDLHNRYRVLLPQLQLEVFLPPPATLRLAPGDHVRLRLDRVSPREDIVKLSLA
jgi:exoribonuclease-2